MGQGTRVQINNRGIIVVNILWVSTSMFLSVIVGAVVFALLGIYLPDVLDAMLTIGDVIADWLYHLELINTQVRNVIRFLINAQQMVFLFLVILSRVLFALGAAMFRR